MLPTNYADIELVESADLPQRTLVAPPLLARELRLVLADAQLTIRMGALDAVLISSDLYEAFQVWSSAQETEGDDEPDGRWN
jgi:hypothetical protein